MLFGIYYQFGTFKNPIFSTHLYLGVWLVVWLLSSLLIPCLPLLVTSISLLLLLFFMKLCEPLWVSLTVEKVFTINLDVLSLVLYGWRSLEATIRIRLKAKGRRPKSKTLEHQKTSDSRDHYSTKAHPKASIPTLKPSSAYEPIRFRARHNKLILQ